MATYQKKPVQVEAYQWTGVPGDTNHPQWALDAIAEGRIRFGRTFLSGARQMSVTTLEGDLEAIPGDYIIRGVAGEIYPCKCHIFDQTYELVCTA